MTFVVSLPHPAFAVVDPVDPERRVSRSYWDTAPIAADGPDRPADVPRTISALFTSLARANFRVDTVLEPEPPARGPRSSRWTDVMRYLPATLILRARKLGI
jgi:hypothetical protein